MKIDQINPDFPGFGVVVPYRTARDQMQMLGYSINQPYRIVIILKHLTDRSALEDRYPGLTLQYDRDTIQEKEKIFQDIAEILTFCGIILLGIISSFLFLLFLGYFREKQYVFDLIRIYRIGGY